MSENLSPAQSEWDALAGLSPEPAHAQPGPWYRRRPGQIALGGVTVTAVVLGSFAVVAVAKGPAALAPADALQHAAQTLIDEPFGVTVTSDQEDGAVKLVHTDSGTQVSVTTEDGQFEGAYANGRLYLRIQPTDSDALGIDPMMTGFLAGFSSIDSLLKGEWVSLDVSEDSKVLDALEDVSGAPAAETGAAQLQEASEEFSKALERIVDGLREPVLAAITENSEITEPSSSGAERHLHLELDVDGLEGALEAPVTTAMEDVIAAVEEFAADAGQALPPGAADQLSSLRDEFAMADEQADDAGPEVATADFYLTEGEFSRIEAEGTHLAFDAEPKLTGIESAVSMDEDLLRLLPMVASLMDQASAFGTA